MIKERKLSTVLIVTLFSLLPTCIFGQSDSTRYFILDLTAESGVFFPRSEDFQNTYNSKSNFNWSIGTKFGTSNWTFLPWIKYSQYQSKTDSVIANDTDNDSLIIASRRQISFGLMNPIRLKNDNYIQVKCGLTYNFLSEESTDLYSESFGFIMSAGYMRRISKYLSYYMDLNYEYTKSSAGYTFKDWSGFLLNMGINLNFGADETLK
ncbi:hypothetical protein [Halocola ammonii]